MKPLLTFLCLLLACLPGLSQPIARNRVSTNINQNPLSIDLRPALSANSGNNGNNSVFFPANTLYSCLTNITPGTIKAIHFSLSPSANSLNYATDTNYGLNAIISIFADGQSNGCTFSSFYGCWNARYIVCNPTRMGFSGLPNATLGWNSGYRTGMEINAYTNFSVGITCNQTAANAINLVYSIEYSQGTPCSVQQRKYWHCKEQQFVTTGASLTNTLISSGGGEYEELMWNYQSASGTGLTELENSPTIYADGNVFYGPGAEDFFIKTAYFLQGTVSAANDFSGCYAANDQIAPLRQLISLTPGYASGFTAYRFLPGLNASSPGTRIICANTLTMNQVFSQTCTNNYFQSWWTAN